MLDFSYNQLIDTVLMYLDANNYIDDWVQNKIKWFGIADFEIRSVYVKNNKPYITLKDITVMLSTKTKESLKVIPVEEELVLAQSIDSNLDLVDFIDLANAELGKLLDDEDDEVSDLGGITYLQGAPLKQKLYKFLDRTNKTLIYQNLISYDFRKFEHILANLQGDDLAICLERQRILDDYIKYGKDEAKIRLLKTYPNGVKVYVSSNLREDFEALYSGMLVLTTSWNKFLNKKETNIVLNLQTTDFNTAREDAKLRRRINKTEDFLDVVPMFEALQPKLLLKINKKDDNF